MARTDNFTNFATDVADSIRSMTGKTDKIQASQFDTEIKGIKTEPNLQDKSIEITENGTTSIVADDGYDGLNSIEVTTNIENSNIVNTYLIKNGIEKTDITGGSTFEQKVGLEPNGVGMAQGTDSLNLYTGLWARCDITFNNEFDLSQYSKLYIDYAFPSSNVTSSMRHYMNAMVVFVNSNISTYMFDGNTVERTILEIPITESILDSDQISINCSNLSGDNGVNESNYKSNYPLKIYNVWLQGEVEQEDVSEELSDYDAKLTTQESLLADIVDNLNNKAAGGTNPLNIFVQETEPTSKSGIWLQSNNKYSNVYYTPLDTSEIQLEKTENAIPLDFSHGYGTKVGDYMYLFVKTFTYKYNIASGEYTLLSSIPVNFQHAGGCTVGTDVYLLAGAGSSGVSSASYLYKYNTVDGTYTKLANRPIPSTGGKIVAVGSALYSWGCDWNTTYAASGYKYDISTNTWSEITKPPRLQCYGAVVAHGTNVYILGSSFGISDSGTNEEKAKSYKYDTLTDTYTEITSVPIEMFTGSYINSVLVGNTIYLFSVLRDDYSVACNYKYNITTDIYTKLSDTDVAFKCSWASYYDSNENTIYMFGGVDTLRDVYKITTLDMPFNENSIVLDADSEKTSDMQFNLLDNVFINNDEYLKLYIKDVLYCVRDDIYDNTIPTYYGDGTQWVKFKN